MACHPLQFLLWNYASSLARFSGNKPALEQRKSLFWSEKWEVGNAQREIGEVGSRRLEAPLPLSYSLPISLTCSKALVSEPAINIVAVYTRAAELPPKWVKHKNNRSKYKRGLNHTENVEEGTVGETCLANSCSKFISVVCSVCYNVREVILLDRKLQFLSFASNFFANVKFHNLVAILTKWAVQHSPISEPETWTQNSFELPYGSGSHSSPVGSLCTSTQSC